MSQPISTTSEGMQRAAGYCAEAYFSAKNGVGDVQTALAELKRTWVGDTSEIFNNAMNAWFGDANMIISKLYELTDLLDGSRDIIQKREAENAATAGSLNIGGPGLPGM